MKNKQEKAPERKHRFSQVNVFLISSKPDVLAVCPIHLNKSQKAKGIIFMIFQASPNSFFNQAQYFSFISIHPDQS